MKGGQHAAKIISHCPIFRICSIILLQKQKAEFYANERDMLVQEMMKRNINLKEYQVQYYLNKRYNEIK